MGGTDVVMVILVICLLVIYPAAWLRDVGPALLFLGARASAGLVRRSVPA